jgi:MtN3 and saliva related transmembrane protein
MQYIGFIAAFLTTTAFIPQVIQVFKTKDTSSISLVMYIMMISGVFLWMTHGLIIGDWPLIIANLITFVLAGSVLVLKIRYK